MAAIGDYFTEVKRIRDDVSACLQRHKLWTDTADQQAFYDDLDAAYGKSINGRDLRAEALRETADPDVRRRIENVEKWLTEFVPASQSGVFNSQWTKASCGLRDALRELEPFTVAETGTQAAATAGPNVSVNAQMLDTIQRRPESKDWSVRQWQTHLPGHPSPATIHGAPAWKTLMALRKGEGADLHDSQTCRDQSGKRSPRR
jgi:hypothetical protein